MLIAQITDTHIGFDRGDPDEYNMARLSAVLDRLIDGPNQPDLLLLSGDLTEYGDAASYAWLANSVARCPFPVHVMVGNHDERDPLVASFPQAQLIDGFLQYALEFHSFRLIALDTLEPGRHGGAFCETRTVWLGAQLAARPDTPTLIAMHHPPFESGIAWLGSDAGEDWVARFAATIAGHGQIRAIICGHLHRTIHTAWNGISLSVCGSTAPAVGLDLRPIDSSRPDGRAMIVDELPGYALHYWDGERFISHFETVGALEPLARFDEGMQPVVRLIEEENRPR